METTSIHSLAEAALKAMKATGASQLTIGSYKRYEFGEVIRFCEEINRLEYSADVIDEFILTIRLDYENGKIPRWKWKKIRRGGEVLKYYHDTHTLDLPRCRQWETLYNQLRRQPTEVEMADPHNIWGLTARTKKEMLKFGFAGSTTDQYSYIFEHILQWYVNRGLTQYSPILMNEIVLTMQEDYKSGKMPETIHCMSRRAVSMIEEQHNTGTLVWKRLSYRNPQNLSDIFTNVLNDFENIIISNRAVKGSTVKQYKSNARQFLLLLEDLGITSLQLLTPELISEQITAISQKYSGGLRTKLQSIRVFLESLYANGHTEVDLSLAVPKFSPIHRKLYEGFTNEETERLLAVPDIETLTGKRDYAIMMLAFQTGLRSCDISNLRLQDIRWHTNEIKIVQVKTGVVLTLPLPIESGNAIADYLLHARPQSDEPYIFLGVNAPFHHLESTAVGAVLFRYTDIVGIQKSVTKQKGFHNFRRAFGKRLLEADIPISLLSELLGHTSPNSISPYISIDESTLKNCALGLLPCAKAGVDE